MAHSERDRRAGGTPRRAARTPDPAHPLGMSALQNRVAAGAPTGGQFAATARPETGTVLSAVPDPAPAPLAAKLTRPQEQAIERLFSRGNVWPNYGRGPHDSDGADRRVVDALVAAGIAKWAPHTPGHGVLPHVVPALPQPTQVSPGTWRVTLPATATPRHAAAMVSGAWRRGAYDGRSKNSWDSLSSRARQVATTDDGHIVVEVEAAGLRTQLGS